VERSGFYVTPEADTPGSDPETPLGRLDSLEAHNVSTFIFGVTVEGSDNTLTGLGIEAVSIS